MSDAHRPSDDGIGSGGHESFIGAPTIEFEHGSRTFEVRVVTKKDRLLCPIGTCARRFELERSLSQHISKKHGIQARYEDSCAYCNSDIDGREPRTYCSKECAGKGVHYNNE